MDFKAYLEATDAIDCEHPAIIEHSAKSILGLTDDVDKAIALYYAVRDSVRYDPYKIGMDIESSRASVTLHNGFGYCVTKAVLLTALGRAVGIATRLGFADVRNHLTSAKLRAVMQSDVFVWHGYVEFYLNGEWVKATPAFNLSLCQKAGIKPLEFNGHDDSIFHEYDQSGKRHMEYLNDHGQFADLPLEMILNDCIRSYPNMMSYLKQKSSITGDFENEAEATV